VLGTQRLRIEQRRLKLEPTMPFVRPDELTSYETVVVGSGFGSFFFLHEFLKRRRFGRTLLIEWGAYKPHDWQVKNQANSIFDTETLYTHGPGEKSWHYSVAFGGGTVCWWAQCPRNHPNDFRLRSSYGVAVDWPFSYDELTPYYTEAEQVMLVAGAEDIALHYPGTGAYVQPAHRMSDVDKLMKAAQPDMHFVMPNGRLSRSIGERSRCCVTAACRWCPVDAKFTALNSMQHIIEHPDLDICVNAKVEYLDVENRAIRKVRFVSGGKEYEVHPDLVVLGANGLQSPVLLLQSGFDHPLIGRYIHEKLECLVEVYLDGVNNFNGSTITTCINLSLLDGDHRKDYGAAMLYFENYWHYGLRPEYGRWREILPITISVETMPQFANIVTRASDGRPHVSFNRSDYDLNGLKAALEKLPAVLRPLPVERIERRQVDTIAVHLQGTLRMGDDPAESVVDSEQIHHQVRNLLVVGSSVFPTAGSAPPSLTVAAMSLRAARLLNV
jgi:choline dehydrogenase-like flavoprotein